MTNAENSESDSEDAVEPRIYKREERVDLPPQLEVPLVQVQANHLQQLLQLKKESEGNQDG